MDKKKILLIDNEEGFANLVKLNLEMTGKYTVRVETKGTNGFSTAKEFNPDLILLDIVMPDMSGTAVATQIRQNELTKNIPILFLTATVLEQELPSDNVIGGNFFISKPVNTETLINCIEKNIKK